MDGVYEREILSDFLERYCNLPCLWDVGSEEYKDKNKKAEAWESLVEILKKVEPSVDVPLTKKKIEHMRTAYKREEKKILESAKTATKKKHLHVPNLWYFNLLCPVYDVLNSYEHARSGDDTPKRKKASPLRAGVRKKGRKKTLSESDPMPPCINIKLLEEPPPIISKATYTPQPSQKLPEISPQIETPKKTYTTQESTPSRSQNYFGIYVGEQLEQVENFQRLMAEKLISDVLFLAKTGNLRFDTKIVPPPGNQGLTKVANNFATQYYLASASPQFRSSTSSTAPRLVPILPKADLLNEDDKNIDEITISESEIEHDDHSYSAIIHEGPASVLKELLLVKNKKKEN